MTVDLSYPIGRFRRPAIVSEPAFVEAVDAIRRLPAAFRMTVSGWTGDRLTTPYRPGGWTARQVVHHVADSHANAYVRFKLALTEDWPGIKPYEEARWAELAELPALVVAFKRQVYECVVREFAKYT